VVHFWNCILQFVRVFLVLIFTIINDALFKGFQLIVQNMLFLPRKEKTCTAVSSETPISTYMIALRMAGIDRKISAVPSFNRSFVRSFVL
jgi:hypothetical protein